MADYKNVGLDPVGAPHAYEKQEVGKPSRNAGDMNGHVGSSNAGYEGTHSGFGYGSRNADGSRILEFEDGLNLVICNTLYETGSQVGNLRSRPGEKHS